LRGAITNIQAPDIGAARVKCARSLLFTSSSLVALATFFPSASHAQSFQSLGFSSTPGIARESRAYGVSADGSVVAVTSGFTCCIASQAMRWTAATGLVPLSSGIVGSQAAAYGISGDGLVLAGRDDSGQAMRWTATTGIVRLGLLPGGFSSWANGTNFDGSVVVGYSGSGFFPSYGEAFRWTSATHTVPLGALAGAIGSQAYGTNADGTVVVGYSEFRSGGLFTQQATQWVQSHGDFAGAIQSGTGLGFLPGHDFSRAVAVTADGATIVGASFKLVANGGTATGEAFAWNKNTGMVGLGKLAGTSYSEAISVSGDGAVVVGNTGVVVNGFDSVPQRGFIWDQVFGMQDLRQVLVTKYGLNVAGWDLTTPYAVSADGRTIVGWGNDPNGNVQAFRASGLLVNRFVNGSYVVAPGVNDAIGILGGAGTVQIGAGASLSVAGNNFSSDAANFPNSVFIGKIAGAGDLIKAGSGLWQFNGSFESQGRLIINSGTFALNGAGHIGGASDVVVNATLDISAVAGASTSIRTLSGSGNVTLDTKILTMTDASGNFSGTIGGRGGLTLAAGREMLSGANTYTGETVINGGQLNVTGSTASSRLTRVNNSGTLVGTGTVGNTTIANGATFAPGNGTPGSSMTVAGNLAFQSGALYLVALNPATSTFASVSGSATLNGGAGAAFLSGNYVAKQYTILTAAGGVNGTFGSFNTLNIPNGFKSTLSYDANNAYLNLALIFVPPPSGLNANQQSAANAIVGFFNANAGIPLVFGGLTPAGLTQISGEVATGTQQTTFDAMGLFMGLLTDPFIAGRGDTVSGGASAPQFAEESDAANGNARSKSERDAYAAVYRKAPMLADPFTHRWSVWAAGYGGSQTTDGNTVLGSNNTRSSIGGVAVGADYRFSPYTLAGFALAGGATNFSVNGLGSGRSDLFQAGAFVRHNVGAAYLTGALAYGWQDITTDRTVAIAGTDLLRARFNANAFSGRAEGGYRFVTPWIGGIGLTPYAAGQFVTFDLPTYAEQAIAGANTFALSYASKSVTDTRSELGLRSDKSFAMQNGIFTLRGRAAWAHDFNPDRNIAATFQTLPGASFVVNGAMQASDAALVTGSAEMKWLNGFSLAATFEGEFSGVTRSYAGKGVARYTW
jgi:uncharacterized protein with beta-barrel porin domain